VTATLNPVSGANGLTLADVQHQNPSTIGLSPLSATLTALKNSGLADTLASPRIRARNKEKARILIGSRVPVITNSVTPTNTAAVVTGSVQYLDVGLSLNVQPTIYEDGDVAIKVGLEDSLITNQITTSSGTIAYTISTRNADTLLRLKDGETQILAGLIQDSETRSISGIPGLSEIPGLGRLFGSHTNDREKSELVLSITPRIIRAPGHAAGDDTEFWYGTETRPRSAPVSAIKTIATTAAPAASAIVGATAAGGGSPEPTTSVTPGSVSGGSGVVTTNATNAGVAAADMEHTAQAIKAAAAAPAGELPKAGLTLSGPADVRVGDSFTVGVDLQSDQPLNRIRAQVRYDSSTLQLVGADNGDLLPEASGAKVTTPIAGGAMVDATASAAAPFDRGGTLMVLHFKALKARPVTAISAQLAVVGSAGTTQATSTPEPLTFAVGAPN
jgi:general secretion pathway protein D